MGYLFIKQTIRNKNMQSSNPVSTTVTTCTSAVNAATDIPNISMIKNDIEKLNTEIATLTKDINHLKGLINNTSDDDEKNIYSACIDGKVNKVTRYQNELKNLTDLLPKTKRVIFMVDATSSMHTTLVSIQESMKEILPIMTLMCPDIEIYFVIYRDFDMTDYGMDYKFYGPYAANDVKRVISDISKEQPYGGGDAPENQKYAIHRIMNEFEIDEDAIIFNFTDAPPHSIPYTKSGNSKLEGEFMQRNQFESDWIKINHILKNKKYYVYTIGRYHDIAMKYYATQSHITEGEAILLVDTNVKTITKATIAVIARAFGYDDCDLTNIARLLKVSDDILIEKENKNFFDMKIQILSFTENSQPILRSVFDIMSRKIITERFKNDVAFRGHCFSVFTDLMNTGHIMALCYNPIVGCIYRQMVIKPKIESEIKRRDDFTNLMSQTVQKLNPNDKAIIDAWLESSYNELEAIRELIDPFEINGTNVPFYALQIKERVTKKDFTTAANCLMPHNIRLLVKMLSSVFVVNEKPKLIPEVYLPCSIPNDDLFEYISHLMCPGTKMNGKQVIHIAFCALLSKNELLLNPALEFLHSQRGKWWNPNIPEFYVLSFFKLVLEQEKNHGGLITPEEKQIFEKLMKIGTLMITNPVIRIERKYIPERSGVQGSKKKDNKLMCVRCNQYRSITVTTDCGNHTPLCGLCLSYSQEEIANLPDGDKEMSFIYFCTQCDSQYAVRNVDALKTKPKCYYCRNNIDIKPTKNCSVCEMKVIVPDSEQLSPDINENFMCGMCAGNNGQMRVEVLDVYLRDIVTENPLLIDHFLGIHIDPKQFFQSKSMWSLKDTPCLDDQIMKPTFVLYGGRPIINNNFVIDEIEKILVTGRVDAITCPYCFTDFLYKELQSVCGNNACKTIACLSCIKTWYQENEPGTRVFPNRFNCPSCRRKPSDGIYSLCNPSCCKIKVIPDFKHDWHYAWCKDCNKIKEFLERECAGPEPPDIRNYICDDCAHPNGIKACPFCGFKTQKSSGCDHIVCPKQFGGCGIHWCYRCDGPIDQIYHADNSRDVYNHLWTTHGNIWGPN